MLEKITIENVALIKSAEIFFTKGLNVLSGETGAGKSVILESLNFVLGAKADKSLIKSGAEYCKVTAIFNVENNIEIQNVLTEMDFDNDSEIIISRKFSIDGKSSIKLNGNTVTVSMLKKITCKLVDLHGQSEHYELLSNSNQLKLIDSIGEKDVFEIKQKLKEIFSNYKNVINQIEELGGDASQRAIKLDILNFQINEIKNAEIYDGEEEELNEIRSRLIHQEKILSSLSTLKTCLTDENGAGDILVNASRSLSSITDLNEKYQSIYDRLSDIISEINDISDESASLIEDAGDIEYNPQEIEDRLDLIKKLKKKYGNSYEEISLFLENAEAEKTKIENFDELYEKLIQDKSSYEKELYTLYKKLSSSRKKTAEVFCKNVLNELRELGMPNANFSINFTNEPLFEECKFNSSNGFDDIEFQFSANLGQPEKPLAFIISGGEMSRFMLSIKAQSAKFNQISTFVFDEIDAGISGKIALEVSKKFAKISKDVQIIAISHLPQISAMADNNLLIEKNESDNSTYTTIKTLSNEQKINELVRLVGGVDSSSAINLANELINNANNYKKSI